MKTLLLGLSLLIGCSMAYKAGGGATPAPAPTAGPTTATPPGPTSPTWQQMSENEANGIGDGAGEFAEDQKYLIKVCGHAVAIKWDWASFKGHAFTDMAPTGPGRMCADDTLRQIGYFCGNPQRAVYRDSVLPIVTVTCHYKECTELPPSGWTRDDGILDPGYEYAFTNNGTNLDKSFCEKTQFTVGFDLDRWFRDPHYPKVRKPGSAQRP